MSTFIANALGDRLPAEGAFAVDGGVDGGEAAQAALTEVVSARQRAVGAKHHLQAHGAGVLPLHDLTLQTLLQLLLVQSTSSPPYTTPWDRSIHYMMGQVNTLHHGTGPYATQCMRSIHYITGQVNTLHSGRGPYTTHWDRSTHTMGQVHTLHHGRGPYTTPWDRSIHYTMEEVHTLHHGTGPYYIIHYMMGQVHILHNHNETGPYTA